MQEALQNDEINHQIKEITTKLQTIKDDNISKESTKQTIPKKDNFKILIEKIYERNYDLGQCFEENIHFVSFENDILTWESTAQDKCKKSLITYWSIIKFFVQDIFGIKTQIKAIKSQNQPPKPVKKEVKEEPVMPSSCVQNCAGLSDTKEEIDSKDILQTPLVKKAIELFDVQKIKIKSKV
jgi:DNA polymerase-3 subunit gamma/tau